MNYTIKLLAGAAIIAFASMMTYYIVDKEKLQQEPVIEIGYEPDLVKNRLTHDEMQSVDEENKLRAQAIS